MRSWSPREGAFDALWLGLAYVLGSQLIALGQAVKALSVSLDASAAVTLVGAMGRMALPPILLSLAVEILLGRERAYRRGIYLLPLVLVVTAANVSRQWGWAPWTEFMPAALGSAWSLLAVVASKGQVQPSTDGEGRGDTPSEVTV